MSEIAVKGFPCKDCGDRFVGCHGICDIYKQAKIENDNLNEKKKAMSRPVRSISFFENKPKRASNTVVNVFRGGRSNDK